MKIRVINAELLIALFMFKYDRPYATIGEIIKFAYKLQTALNKVSNNYSVKVNCLMLGRIGIHSNFFVCKSNVICCKKAVDKNAIFDDIIFNSNANDLMTLFKVLDLNDCFKNNIEKE